MKKLELEEIQKHLSKEEIEEELSKLLINDDAEESLKGPNIRISPYSNGAQFTNRHWQYYLPAFRKMQPKSLYISSFDLDAPIGIETMESLEDIYIGFRNVMDEGVFIIGMDDSKVHTRSHKEFLSLAKTVSQLPNIKRLIIGWTVSGPGGAFREMSEYLCSQIPTLVAVDPYKFIYEFIRIPIQV